MGRLIPAVHIWGSIRWMGSTLAVYECGIPGEGGSRGRKSLCRGKKRRGCRSRRGGRKRRALVGAALETSIPTPPRTLKVGRKKSSDYKRRLAYSQALIDKWCRLGKTIAKMKERTTRGFPSMVERDLHWANLERAMDSQRRTRRSWFDLAKATDGPGSDPAFRQMRFNVLSLGLDEFHSRALSRQGQVASSRRGYETQDEIMRGPLATEVKPQSGCTFCQGVRSKGRLCRHCGGGPATPNRKKSTGESPKAVVPGWCEEHFGHSWRCRDEPHKPPPVLTRAKAKGKRPPRG